MAHVTTPHDLQSVVTTWFAGSRLKTGGAFDLRPGAYLAGSLAEYRQSLIRRIAWRTVLSAGTSPDVGESENVLFGVGVRVPVLDRGDPRTDSSYIHDLEAAYVRALDSMPPCPLRANCRLPDADSATKGVRADFFRRRWNAPRVDVGFTWLWRARSGYLKKDSVGTDRRGLWVAGALPVTRLAQLTVSARLAWVAGAKVVEESARHVGGGTIRVFPWSGVALSVEGARVWSRYRDGAALNEAWSHVAAGVGVRVPAIGGWIGLGYRGDSSHRENVSGRLALSYAYSMDQRLKR